MPTLDMIQFLVPEDILLEYKITGLKIKSNSIQENDKIIAAVGFLGYEFKFNFQEDNNEYCLTSNPFSGMESSAFINTGKSVSLGEIS